jgi:uncharacterized protein YodC (DUF2158 family)
LTAADQDFAQRLLGGAKPIVAGAVVYLNSGGPPMTVKSVRREKVSCEWFDKTDRVKCHEFAKAMLNTIPIRRDGRPVGLVVIGDLTAEQLSEAAPTGQRVEDQ